MKKRVILLILILLNLILSTSGIAQEELLTLKDTSISNPKIDTNKISTTQDQIKNNLIITKEDTSKTNSKINEIQRTTTDRVTTNNIETNAIKNIESPIQSNQETIIKTRKNKEKSETIIPNKDKKTITLKNIFEVNNLDELCGYCGFSGSECINFKNYLIKNSLIVSN